jgi:hypothetical protein
MSVPAHVELFYRIKDAKNKAGTMTQSFPIAVDIAVLQDYARGMGQFIDAAIKGQIVACGLSLVIDLATITGIKTAPLADSDVEEGADFTFSVSGGGNTGFRIPTFDEALMVAGTNLVDTTVTAVTDIVNRTIAGRTLGAINVSPSNIYGSDVTALESALESFVSS